MIVMRDVIRNIVFSAALLTCGYATQAQTESVLHSFAGNPDGANPYAGLTLHKGNFYGTTMLGGTSNLGTVFEISPEGKEKVLHSFAGGADGSSPQYGVVFDTDGNLYGTTPLGGASNNGTVFMMTASGTETVVYSFPGGDDGASPSSGVILDDEGNLYGTTMAGGTYACGTVFKLAPSGVATVLYSFTGLADGDAPAGGLIRNSEGDLFGTAGGGMSCIGSSGPCGVVFKVTPSGSETVLHSFKGDMNDGISPSSGLIAGMYGTTSQGGENGRGSVYKVSPSGEETVLFSFGESDEGYTPRGNLLAYGGGLYGTTLDAAYPPCNCGAIYELIGSNLTPLYDFNGSPNPLGGAPDGAFPNGYLVVGSKDHFYGTTQKGGTSNKGTVFELIQ
jgi:uncharacterized repeat protein (TIGR03803 family)